MTNTTINSGQLLQEALFVRLSENNDLNAAFAANIDSARTFPYFSFDGVESVLRDEELGLVAHAIEFSVWSDVLAPKDASRLTTDLLAHFGAPLTLEGAVLLRFTPEEITARADAQARAWRTRINFTALTQAN